MPSLTVIRPGMLTTVQDLGRWGYQDAGVPVAGPMDAYSHRLANRLVGNPDGAPRSRSRCSVRSSSADGDIVCAVAGAEFALTVDGEPGRDGPPFVAPAGARLRFGAAAPARARRWRCAAGSMCRRRSGAAPRAS